MRKIFSVISLCIFIMVSAPFAGAAEVDIGSLNNMDSATAPIEVTFKTENSEYVVTGWDIDIQFTSTGPYFNELFRVVSIVDKDDGDPENGTWQIMEGTTEIYSGTVSVSNILDGDSIVFEHDKLGPITLVIADIEYELGIGTFLGQADARIDCTLSCNTDLTDLVPPTMFPQTPTDVRYISQGSPFEHQVELRAVNVGSRDPLDLIITGSVDRHTLGSYPVEYDFIDIAGKEAVYKIDPSDTTVDGVDGPFLLTVNVVDAPTVVATSPQHNDIDVNAYSVVTVTFSEAMDQNTITSSTFDVIGANGTVTYDAGTQKATFSPDSNLNYSTLYTVTLTQDIKGLSGDPIPDVYEFKFTTEAGTSATPAGGGGGGGGGGCFIKTLK